MPNDAKLGLVVGVVLVIAAAVVFTRKEPAPASAAGEHNPASVSPAQAEPRGQYRPAKARPTARAAEAAETDSESTEATATGNDDLPSTTMESGMP